MITFVPATRRIVLSPGTTSLDVRDLYSRWKDWLLLSDNTKWPEAFRAIGGDVIDSGAGTSVPAYAYLLNGWKVVPQSANHTLTVTGGVLLVDGGGDPFADVPGYTIRVAYSQPAQAITVATGGGGGGLQADERDWLMALALRHGLVLGSPVAISPVAINAPGLSQTISESGGVVTVTRQ